MQCAPGDHGVLQQMDEILRGFFDVNSPLAEGSISSFDNILPSGAAPQPEDKTEYDKSNYDIEIPEGLEQLSRKYVAARRNELSRMMNFSPGHGMDELRTFGHNMKGNGLSFGFPELTRLGAAIEEAARDSNRSEIAEHLEAVREYVEYASMALS